MPRPTTNDFDHASLEAMMERYRTELLRYQRATPPGKPTLAQNLETSEKGRAERNSEAVGPKQVAPLTVEVKQPTRQTVLENKKMQPEGRRDKVMVETPPIMLAPTAQIPYSENQIGNEEQAREPQAKDKEDKLEVLEPLQSAPLCDSQLSQPIDTIFERALMISETTAENKVESPSKASMVPQNSAEMLSQRHVNIEQVPEPTTQWVIDSYAEKKPKAVVAPLAPIAPPPSVVIVSPEPKPEPIKNNRAVEPDKTEHTGCIAHTEFEKSAGAYGVFRPYERMGKYTLASFLQTPGEAVQTLVRFAADIPMGSADAIRCRRSFTVKFFCREGEYDLFGMHLPVSVGQTKNTLSDCCAAWRANPQTGLRTRAAFWEFLVTHPEALHATMWIYSDLGTIGSYRAIDGYGLPCIWVNAKNERRAVRPCWLSRQRPQALTRFESEELAGSDPDGVARDLAVSIQAGERPQYELNIQVIEPEQFASLSFDPFDPTAIWPTEQFKPHRIGLLTLERVPDDVQTELDCARFRLENIIPGIEYVPAPARKSNDDFTQVQQYLRSLGEFSRHRLIDNLTEELLRLPPLLLEQVLILFSRADLEFGQAVTLALGG
ncbi:MAG: catalase [Candidatus Fimivivens sp.]